MFRETVVSVIFGGGMLEQDIVMVNRRLAAIGDSDGKRRFVDP